MDFNRVTHNCLVDVRGVDGSPVEGFPFTLPVFDMSVNWTPIPFGDGGIDVSLSGNKRFDIRGYDLKIKLNWSTTSNLLGSYLLLDGLKSSQAYNTITYFYPSESTDQKIEVLVNDFTWDQTYMNSIGYSPMELVLENKSELGKPDPILRGINFGSETITFGNETITFGES